MMCADLIYYNYYYNNINLPKRNKFITLCQCNSTAHVTEMGVCFTGGGLRWNSKKPLEEATQCLNAESRTPLPKGGSLGSTVATDL